jgi:hypothetical protein
MERFFLKILPYVAIFQPKKKILNLPYLHYRFQDLAKLTHKSSILFSFLSDMLPNLVKSFLCMMAIPPTSQIF